jgi:uncharacterized protein (DUF362 family)
MQMSLFKGSEVHGEVDVDGREVKLSAWAMPSKADIVENLRRFLASDPHVGERLLTCKEVWIKPNITSAEPAEHGRTTQPFVLDGLIKAIREFRGGSTRIIVADSSVIGCDTFQAALVAGIREVCNANRVRFVDLRRKEFVNVVVDTPYLFQELRINAPFLDKDIFKVNVGKIKSTYGSAVSFSLKNSKGVLHDAQKLEFHLKGLQQALCDLASCLSWDLVVLEGLPMSELGRPAGNGPLGICSDPVVLDGFFALVFKIPWRDAFHLERLAELKGINEKSFEHLPGFDAFRSLFGRLAYSRTGVAELARQYNVTIADGRPCSACTESFAKALPQIKPTGAEEAGPVYVIGGNHGGSLQEQIGANLATFVGNCSFSSVGSELESKGFPEAVVELWKKGKKMPGCPPTISELKRLGAKKEEVAGDARVSEEILRAFEINELQLLQKKNYYREILPFIPQNSVSFEGLGNERMVGAELICAAICHQMNWEFLRRQVFRAISEGAEWWQARRVGEVRVETISRLFADYHDPKRVKAGERARMLRSLGQLFQGDANSYVSLVQAGGGGEEVLTDVVRRLEGCRVFSADPARKKLQVFLHSIACYERFRRLDQLCEPAIDYHIMRLYLRRGDVSPSSKVGHAFLNQRLMRRSSTVTALRKLVSEALKRSAQYAGLPLRVVNGIEWWVGRSVCLRDGPDCELAGEMGGWLKGGHSRCPFQSACFAYNCDRRLLKVQEPSYKGSFY